MPLLGRHLRSKAEMPSFRDVFKPGKMLGGSKGTRRRAHERARCTPSAEAVSVAYARGLLRAHQETYPLFWRWSQEQVDVGMLPGPDSVGLGAGLFAVGIKGFERAMV